jgi:hypothetical protein
MVCFDRVPNLNLKVFCSQRVHGASGLWHLMAIYRQLSEGAFEPAAIKTMTVAYELALTVLQLTNRHDPVTDLIAEKIILVFRAGETDPHAICKRTLKEIGIRAAD